MHNAVGLFGRVKLAGAATLAASLVPSLVFGSLTVTPKPLTFNTVWVQVAQNYQGVGILTASGETGHFWFKINKFWNIDGAWVNGDENLQLVNIENAQGWPVYISVVKDDQDEGIMMVVIYRDDGDEVFEPGAGDDQVDSVWVYVDPDP